VFAIACRNNLDEEAKLALAHTFSINLVHQIPEHLQTISVKTYHRLLTEHAIRREQLISSIDETRRSMDIVHPCRCVEERVRLRISERPFLDRETLETCVTKDSFRCMGGSNCVSTAGLSSIFLSDAMCRLQTM